MGRGRRRWRGEGRDPGTVDGGSSRAPAWIGRVRGIVPEGSAGGAWRGSAR